MKLGKLGEQHVLMSEKAFRQIQFLDYEIADNNIYYPKRKARDEAALASVLSMANVLGCGVEDIIEI